MVARGQFYAGSQLLMPLVSVVGLPLDQLNFLVCQCAALALAIPFRKVLSPSTTKPSVRLIVELVAGLALALFCFGYQVWYLIVQSTISYFVMMFGSPQWSHKVVFVFCIIYLSVAHIYRQIYDYGGYTLDITGPMMIQTQKLTSLAFALADGHKDQSKLTPDQRSQAIRSVPNVLSFYSFMFYFHGIMCGPLSFYSDYMSFIDGSYLHTPPPQVCNFENVSAVLIKKLITAAVSGILMVVLPPLLCPPESLLSQEFYEKSFLEKNLYILVCMTCARYKYYFAWILGEAINVAAGFGFNGYDENGKAKWDLVDNVNVWVVEFGDSLKVNIDGWNQKTLVWLRRVVYDRAPKYQTFAVFAISAIWHGFYPGYYLTFGSAALFTVAARLVRRRVRPFFQTSDNMKKLYDVGTFVFTRLVNAYITFNFLTLEFIPSLSIYLSLYCWLHLLGIAVVVYFTFISPSKPSGRPPVKQD
ncbi:hypothetical protein C0Q70_07699 [Pomacea canaliculata]|uniref:Uncharacterized protein n=1 Tax=Pomacea canaliculata TaxID=400727 RepID=A0A2T7PFR3_POMCA|nr:hypothetical protein C0Q70_07699 [Pomacea canaliculata]